MKKYLFVFAVLVLLVGISPTLATAYGNIDCTLSDTTHFNIGQGGNSQRSAQKITFAVDTNVDSLRVKKLFKVGNPADNLIAVIRQSVSPYNIVVSSTTSISNNSIPTSEDGMGNDQTFIFPTNDLTLNTPYLFSLERTGSQNNSNYYRITANNNDNGSCSYDSHDSFALAYDGTNYSNNLTTDLVFEINSVFALDNILVDNSSVAANSGYGMLCDNGSGYVRRIAESFTPDTNYDGLIVNIRTQRITSSSPGSVIGQIFSNTSNNVGTLLETASQTYPKSSLAILPDFTTIRFTFNTNITAGTKYWFVLAGDLANCTVNGTSFAFDNANTNINGVFSYETGSADNWIVDANVDAQIQILGHREFFSQIQNAITQVFRNNYGTSSTVIRTLPQGWVVKVLETTNTSGNNVEANGYRWYKVQDLTDGQEGWMAAVKLDDDTVYLDYDENAQGNLEAKTDQQSTESARIPIIEDAVNTYTTLPNTGSSLYSSNVISDFLSDEVFPKELILGVIGRESGGIYDLDNTICSQSDPGGIGLMQVTSDGYKGLGSKVLDLAKIQTACKNNQNNSDYYSNSSQGIYASIKDGLRALQDKHDAWTTPWIGHQDCVGNPDYGTGVHYNCNDLKQISTTWHYNSNCTYLKDVADVLDILTTTFDSNAISNGQAFVDGLSQRMHTFSANQLCYKLHSPGVISAVDSTGNITGTFNGVQSQDIDLSMYDPDKKIGTIFMPTDTYSYVVQGTDTGTYGLTIDNYDDSETPISVDLQNVPLKPDVVHKFTVDWDEVDSTGNGVHVDVDREGDGIYDYGFDTTSTMNDSTAPTTTSSLSGTTGTNGWYTSNVTVTLSASDNAGGTGVLETKYSTDNGVNWNLYSSPFTISNEGTTILEYYSSDNIGNVESTNAQTIKIDKTAPEAKISFDTTNGFPKIEAVDNLSATTVTKVDDSNYTITDNSGHTLKINLLAIQTAPILSNPAVLTMKINSLQYDSAPAITLPITTLIYKWLGSPLTLLTQNVTSLLQFVITGAYNPVNNTTNIVIIQGVGVPIVQTLPGVKIIKLTTNGGVLGFSY